LPENHLGLCDLAHTGPPICAGSDAHLPSIDQQTVNRLKAVGAAIAVHPLRYLSGSTAGGPPLRMIIDSGIHVGAGSDSARRSPTLDPWNMIYYMVTGKNVAGNPGQRRSANYPRRGNPTLHFRERLVSPGTDQAGLDRGRQARRCGCVE